MPSGQTFLDHLEDLRWVIIKWLSRSVSQWRLRSCSSQLAQMMQARFSSLDPNLVRTLVSFEWPIR